LEPPVTCRAPELAPRTRNTWNIIRRADRPGRIGKYSAHALPFSIPDEATKLPSFVPPVTKGQQFMATRVAGFRTAHREWSKASKTICATIHRAFNLP
jgi:hypothetical protein